MQGNKKIIDMLILNINIKLLSNITTILLQLLPNITYFVVIMKIIHFSLKCRFNEIRAISFFRYCDEESYIYKSIAINSNPIEIKQIDQYCISLDDLLCVHD